MVLSARRSAFSTALALFLSFGIASPTHAQVSNGSFETGDFTDWIATDITNPFQPLAVNMAGVSPGFSFFQSAPTEGTQAMTNGFDGDGPGEISLAQDLTVPSKDTSLHFDYRGAWDFNFGAPSLDREFRVLVEPSGGGPALADILVLETDFAVTPTVLDTGSISAALDLSDFADEEVRIRFVWAIPENFMGPGWFQLDNVRFLGKKTGEVKSTSLQMKLNFAKADKDSIQYVTTVPITPGFLPSGEVLEITIGEVSKSFTLDERGQARDDDDSVKFSEDRRQPGFATVALKCKKGDFAAQLASLGMVNDTITKNDGVVLTVPVQVNVDGRQAQRVLLALYTAKFDKKGAYKAK